MKNLIAFSVFILLAMLPATSLAIKGGVQLFAPASVTIEFDPFTGLPSIETADFDFNLLSSQSSTVKIIITPETQPDFEFDAQNTPIELKIDTTGSTQLLGQFETLFFLQSGQSNLLTINFTLPTGQYANAGQHTLNLFINVEDEVTGEALIIDRPLRIDCIVPSRAQTNLAGTQPGFDNGIGIATLDFGNIIFGDSRQLQFQIRGNSDVIIEMSSENSGYLVNENNINISPIPYVIEADGVMSDMRMPLTFTRRPEKSLVGSQYPLIVTIEEPNSGAYAGKYQDILSIDVTPQ